MTPSHEEEKPFCRFQLNSLDTESSFPYEICHFSRVPVTVWHGWKHTEYSAELPLHVLSAIHVGYTGGIRYWYTYTLTQSSAADEEPSDRELRLRNRCVDITIIIISNSNVETRNGIGQNDGRMLSLIFSCHYILIFPASDGFSSSPPPCCSGRCCCYYYCEGIEFWRC